MLTRLFVRFAFSASLVLFLVTSTAVAQDYHSWHTVKGEKDEQVVQLFSDKAGNVYVVTEEKDIYIGMKPSSRNDKQTGRKLFITKYTADMTKVYHKDFPLTPVGFDLKKSGLVTLRGFASGDGVALVSIFHDKANNKAGLFFGKLTADGAFAVANKKIAEVEAKDPEDLQSGFATSPDESRVAVFISGNKGKDNRKVAAGVFSLADGKAAPAVNVDLPVPANDFDVKSIAVSNDGVLAFNAQADDISDVYIYNKGLKKATVSAGENFVHSKALFFSGDELVAAALYSTKKGTKGNFSKVTGNFPNGFVYERFNPKTGASLGRKEAPLPNSEEYKKDDLRNTVVQDVFRLSDGSHVLVCEQHTETTVNSATQGTSTTHYITGPVHFICIKPDGALAWHSSIGKRQTLGRSDYMMSYAAMRSGDNLYFVYNDHPANLNTTPSAIQYFDFGNNSSIVIAKVNANGKVEKQTITQPANTSGVKNYQFAETKIYTPLDRGKAAVYTHKRADFLNEAEEISLFILNLP